MNHTPLHEGISRKLEPLAQAERLNWQRRFLSLGLLAGAIAVPLAAWAVGVSRSRMLWLWGGVVLGLLLLKVAGELLASRRGRDARELARRVEKEHPELRGALLAALEQEAGPEGSLGFLQVQVFQKALAHAAANDWLGEGRRGEMRRGGRWLVLSAVVFAGSVITSSLVTRGVAPTGAPAVAKAAPDTATATVSVCPGDAEVERGTRLIVEAKFGGRAPAEAAVVLLNPDDSPRGRVALNRTVDGNSFGGVIADIAEDARYRVEFEGGNSETYRIRTFEYPALVRIDATITPPAWMDQAPATVKNTMNLGVMEGARVDFRVTVNKPLAAAELFGEDKTIVPLKASPEDPRVLLGGMQPLKTQKYRVHLVDDRERSNKNPPWVTVRVLPNQPPKIELVFPKRDLAVSPIQELPVEGRVWDDFGVLRAGATFMIGDQTREVGLAGEALKGGKKHDLKTRLDLETLHAEPRQLVSYYLWAEDRGSDGKPRRAMSDMFFAEVRHFEDIFREAEAPPGEDKEEKEKGDTDELLATQKEVVNATWRVLRDGAGGRAFDAIEKDVGVLHDSQDIVKTKTEAAAGKAKDAQVGAALRDAVKSMAQASSRLEEVSGTRDAAGLNPALASERAALELLQRAQSREHKVMQSRSSKGKGKKGQMQQQLNNLELKQQEKRYEEQKEAADDTTPAEQKENLQVLSRLKELAARQEALAQKMKELEQQLQQAKTEGERREAERQLKRLQEEQEQMLRDLDSLKERMEKPENLAQMSEMKERMEQAREQARQAAEQLGQRQSAQAAANATKAQRQIEEVRDEFRQRTAKKFADEMRTLKDQARKLEADEKKLSETLENGAAPKPEIAGDTTKQLERSLEIAQMAGQLEKQQKALEKTLEETKKITEAAEVAEPALSTALYDAARKAETGGTKGAMEAARDLAAVNDVKGALQQEQRAAKGITELRENIERAAEQVLGSEAEALRVARAELEKLTKEIEAAAGGKKAPEGREGGAEKQPPGSGEPQPGKKDPNAMAGDAKPPGGEGKVAENGQAGKAEPSKPGTAPGAPPAGGQASAPSPEKSGDPAGRATGGQGQGQGEGTAMAEAKAQESQGKEGEGKGKAANDGKPGDMTDGAPKGGRMASTAGARGAAGSNDGGGGGGGWFFDAPAEVANNDPLTGEGYDRWSDRLRNVEELLEAPELRGQAARIRDEARQFRLDQRRNNRAPQPDVVRTRIAGSLAELRDRVAEELARREAANPLAPLDRDPVPSRYREQVRRYYTELGAGK